MIICFTGMDGTGKTTNAQKLYNKLKQDGNKVVYLRTLSGDTVLRRFLGKLTQQVRKKTHQNPYQPRKGGILRLWPLFSGIDAYLTYIWFKFLSFRNIVIVDRYFYDEIAIMVCVDVLTEAKAWRILKIIPRPDVIFLFEAEAVTAHTRKPEHPIGFFIKQLQFYRNIAPLIGATIVNTEQLDCSQTSQLIANKLGLA